MRKILPEDLVALDTFVGQYPLKVDLVYAKAHHRDNLFGCAIYKPEAKMWCHKELLPIILKAAELCYKQSGLIFELKDCLRPTEAQAAMTETEIVKRHPQWLQEPNRLLSPPGKGGHPRAMAIDIILLNENGEEVDMGTRFDQLTAEAARNYTNLDQEVLARRRLLEECMVAAAKAEGRPILPLPQEWWDFRFPAPYYEQFAPISDSELPEELQTCYVISL